MLVAGYDPALVRRLMADPVHAWRAKTGIELIHKEPDLKEAIRVWVNWNRMSQKDKARSDRKSKKLFGVDNKTHYEQLRPTYGDQGLKKKAGKATSSTVAALVRSIISGKAGGAPAAARELKEGLHALVHAQHMVEGRAVDKVQADSGAEALSKAYRDVFGVDLSHGGRTGWR